MPSGLQKMPVRILLTVLTAAVMILIFCFSMEPADKSDRTSGALSRVVIDVVYPEYGQYPAERQRTLYDSVQHLVRKTAHFTEYTLFGLLLRLCLESWIGKKRWISLLSWATGTMYAVTDELHQRLIDGRSGQWTDVLIDSCGVLAGVLISAGMLYWYRKRKERRQHKPG